MRIKKAVITAAGKGTRHYPATAAVRKEFFPLVDTDGTTKPVIHLIVEEMLASGIEEICIVTDTGGDADFRRYFKGLSDNEISHYRSKPSALEQSGRLSEMGSRLSYAIQHVQEGYGHAVYCAREYVGDEPFLLLLGDHIYLSHTDKRCARQVIDVFEETGISTAGVTQTPEDRLHLFGTVKGHPLPQPRAYSLTQIKEKPEIEYARRYLRTMGLPEGSYFCFFGIQCFTPGIFDCLRHNIRNDIRERGEFQLTSAMDMLMKQEGFNAVEVEGHRFDVGVPQGYIETFTALALMSPYKDSLSCLDIGPEGSLIPHI